jgi:hypothetical protein
VAKGNRDLKGPFESSKVDDCGDFFFFEELLERIAVEKIHFGEIEIFARDLTEPMDSFGFGIAEIVSNDNRLSSIEKFNALLAADTAIGLMRA